MGGKQYRMQGYATGKQRARLRVTMRLILVRHYKTRSNAAGRIIGWGNSPPAQDWEKDLLYVDQNLREQGIEIDAIYSSDLERARRTAEYFAARRNTATLNHSGMLNEVNYGTLYHKSKAWVARSICEYKTDPDYVFPEGESFRQMRARSVAFVNELESRHNTGTLLIVSHAGVIRGLICHFLELDYASNLKRKISHKYIGDFQIESGACIRYDELGKPSEFIDQGIVIASTPLAAERSGLIQPLH